MLLCVISIPRRLNLLYFLIMPIYATNPKAGFDYEILEKYEAGLVLSGHEVKAIRNNKVSIKGVYVKIFDEEAWLVGAVISPYQANNIPKDYDPQRDRKLLLKKSELKYLIGKSQEKGLTLIPLKIFDSHGMIKLELGVGRGKKQYDKRETIKKRETERAIRREI
jgi:SsrA-binding protein